MLSYFYFLMRSMTYLKVSRKNKYLLQLAQNAIFDVKMTQIND